jgi:hypothetical protein
MNLGLESVLRYSATAHKCLSPMKQSVPAGFYRKTFTISW